MACITGTRGDVYEYHIPEERFPLYLSAVPNPSLELSQKEAANIAPCYGKIFSRFCGTYRLGRKGHNEKVSYLAVSEFSAKTLHAMSTLVHIVANTLERCYLDTPSFL